MLAVKRVVRLPIIRHQLPIVRVPAYAKARGDIKQVTVIDYDDQGRPFIRPYVERHHATPGDPYYEEMRHTVTVFCTRKLEFFVALVACHHYCNAPCPEHLAKLTSAGWTHGMKPPAYGKRGNRKEPGEDDEG